MRRFALIQWWTFILVLVIGVTTVVTLASGSTVIKGLAGEDDGLQHGGGGGDLPPAYGDPDLPNGYKGQGMGRMGAAGPVTGSTQIAGDNRVIHSTTMWRVRVFWMGDWRFFIFARY